MLNCGRLYGKVRAMSTPPAPSFRSYIKRGKPVAQTSGASDFLRLNDQISALLPAVRRRLHLQRECQRLMPRMFEYAEVLQLQDGQLTVAVPNAALAARLKQNLPTLQNGLLEGGWQINAIKIKVQVTSKVEKEATPKQIALSDSALQAFASLEQTLDPHPQNAGLRDALARLLSNHRKD